MGKLRKFPKVPESILPRYFYAFGSFLLDPVKRILLRDGEPLPLTPKDFDVLMALVERRGEVVVKEELMQSVWPDTVVEEGNLNRHISTLRKLLGESPDQHEYIVTMPGRGYRFVAEVDEVREETHSQPGPEANRTGPVLEDARPVGFSRRLLAVFTITLLTAGLLATLGLARWRTWNATSRSSQIRALAVLPLQNLSGDPDQDYLSDGLTEALITDLAQIRALRVVSRTSVMQYKGTIKALPKIADELGVDAVVEGSVLRASDRVRVTVQLVQARKDEHLWASTYEGESNDVLALQRNVTRGIAHAVRVTLTPQEQERMAQFRPVNAEAYDLYLKGRFFWNKRDFEGFDKAVDYLNKAVQKDPSYALAYAGLADAYALRGLAATPANDLPKAREAALRALELDEKLAEAHTSLGAIKALYEWDFADAEREFKRAIELNPSYATGHHWYSTLCLYLVGRSAEGLAELRRARELDPLSLAIASDFASTYQGTGEFDKAIELYREIIAMDPNFAPVHLALSIAYERKAMYRNAVFEFREGQRLSGAKDLLPSELGQPRTSADYRNAVRWQLEAMKRESRQPGFWRYDGLARLYARLGENDRAFAALNEAVEQHDPLVIFLKADGQYDSLRSDPRMDALLRRIGLSQ